MEFTVIVLTVIAGGTTAWLLWCVLFGFPKDPHDGRI